MGQRHPSAKERITHLPTPLAAFSPADDPEREEEEEEARLPPAPMAQSLSPEVPRGEPWPGREVVLACWKMPTWRGRLSRDLNQSSISRGWSRPAHDKAARMRAQSEEE